MTRHSRELTRYVAGHVDELNNRATALFQVSLTSATDDEQHSADAQPAPEAAGCNRTRP